MAAYTLTAAELAYIANNPGTQATRDLINKPARYQAAADKAEAAKKVLSISNSMQTSIMAIKVPTDKIAESKGTTPMAAQSAISRAAEETATKKRFPLKWVGIAGGVLFLLWFLFRKKRR